MIWINNRSKFLKISIRLFITGLLLCKVLHSEYRNEIDRDKINEVKKIIANRNISNHHNSNFLSNLKLKPVPVLSHRADNNRDKATAFHDIIIRVSKRYNVDPALIKAIIRAESSFNPHAVSNKGAMGLMQLMPITLKAMGARDPFDPEYNIEAGVRYLKKLLIIFDNDIKLALAAYNAGITKVKFYGGVPPFKSTREYVRKVIRYYNYYKREMFRALSNDHDA